MWRVLFCSKTRLLTSDDALSPIAWSSDRRAVWMGVCALMIWIAWRHAVHVYSFYSTLSSRYSTHTHTHTHPQMYWDIPYRYSMVVCDLWKSILACITMYVYVYVLRIYATYMHGMERGRETTKRAVKSLVVLFPYLKEGKGWKGEENPKWKNHFKIISL